VVGNPFQIIKQVSDEMLQWKTEGTAIYQALPGEMKESWAACEPLREPPPPGFGQQGQASDYKPFRS
jgi:phenylacetic acid degradation protein